MSASHVRRTALSSFFAFAVLTPFLASAQSQLDTTEAQAFVGTWDLAIQSEMGVFNLDLEIADRGGKVAAVVGSPDVGGTQEVTDITRTGESLLLRYDYSQQGQIIPISLTLLPKGESLGAAVNVGGGIFTASGTAIRAD